MIAPDPRTRWRPGLLARAVIVATCALLVAEIAVFPAALAAVRRDWLAQRVTEARLAALSGLSEAPGAEASARERLLRQSGIAAIRVEMPKRTRALLAPLDDAPLALPASQGDEAFSDSALYALAGLLGVGRDGDAELVVSDEAGLGGRLVLRVDGGVLAGQLRRVAVRLASGMLATAVLAALLMFLALRTILVRPLQRLAAMLGGVRAGDAIAAPAGAALPRELASAPRDLNAVARALRIAGWHQARLAAIDVALAKLNHDQRGALSPALLAAERLQSNPDPRVARAGDMLVRAVERATDLMTETVAAARHPATAPARTRFMLRPVVQAGAAQATAGGAALRLDMAFGERVEVEADGAHLTRVFANLVRNAAQSGARAVRVTVEDAAGAVAIRVADDGKGLSDGARDTLFQALLGDADEPGRLGLATVRDLVAGCRGTVELVSSDGNGTVFRLTIPAAPALRSGVAGAGAAS